MSDRLLSYQERRVLPDDLVRYLDAQSEGELTAISWVEPNRLRFTAHYRMSDSRLEDRVFKHRTLGKR